MGSYSKHHLLQSLSDQKLMTWEVAPEAMPMQSAPSRGSRPVKAEVQPQQPPADPRTGAVQVQIAIGTEN